MQKTDRLSLEAFRKYRSYRYGNTEWEDFLPSVIRVLEKANKRGLSRIALKRLLETGLKEGEVNLQEAFDIFDDIFKKVRGEEHG